MQIQKHGWLQSNSDPTCQLDKPQPYSDQPLLHVRYSLLAVFNSYNQNQSCVHLFIYIPAASALLHYIIIELN